MSNSCHQDWRLEQASDVEYSGQFGVWLKSDLPHLCQMVTPMTATLLRWWFSKEACMARTTNFFIDERQAILDMIVAHEVLGVAKLLESRYQTTSPTRMYESPSAGNRRLRYCLRIATEAGKTRVLLALLIWQALNRSAALAADIDDQRFTHRFMIASIGAAACDDMMHALCGNSLREGDFSSSLLAQCATLFLPPVHREQMCSFVQAAVCDQAGVGSMMNGDDMIAIVDAHATWGDASDLPRRVPGLMMFDATPLCLHETTQQRQTSKGNWIHALSDVSLMRGYRLTQIGFLVNAKRLSRDRTANSEAN